MSETNFDDFGSDSRPVGTDRPHNKTCNAVPSGETPKEVESRGALSLTQWALLESNRYLAIPPTASKLPAGVYNQCETQRGIVLEKLDIKVDALIDFPDGLPKIICDEIDSFWKKEAIFHEYGFLHRRGYLLYGAAGCGKTAVVQLVSNRIISVGDVVMICKRPNALLNALRDFRKVEPQRRVVCVFEDIDAIVNSYGDEDILALLDGEYQIDRVLNIATTNYPERLDKRLVARPRRFDRVIKIDMPSSETRRVYLSTKLKINGEELIEWVDKTEELSFAALAELVISVKCLGNNFDTTIKMLKKMSRGKASSTEFFTTPIGIKSDKEYEDKDLPPPPSYANTKGSNS